MEKNVDNESKNDNEWTAMMFSYGLVVEVFSPPSRLAGF